jgi:hypothetical protein
MLDSIRQEDVGNVHSRGEMEQALYQRLGQDLIAQGVNYVRDHAMIVYSQLLDGPVPDHDVDNIIIATEDLMRVEVIIRISSAIFSILEVVGLIF